VHSREEISSAQNSHPSSRLKKKNGESNQNPAWELLKSRVRVYLDKIRKECVEPTEEERNCRRLIARFKKTLQKHYLGVSRLAQTIMTMPFPEKKSHANYISCKSGTIRISKPRTLPRSISYPDITVFENENRLIKEYKEWAAMQESQDKFNELGLLEKKTLKDVNPLIRRVRANSFDCINELGNFPILTNPFTEENEINNGKIENADESGVDSEEDNESSYSEIDKKVN
jgi:hypothetical protein